LNDAIAREIQVSIQYMWQHVQVMGVKAVAVRISSRERLSLEMKHCEKIAERLWYLGGTPTTSPRPSMLGRNLKRNCWNWIPRPREEAIVMYKGASNWRRRKGM